MMKHVPVGNNSSLRSYIRRRNRKGNWLAVILLRISRRDFGFCLATLFLFCLGSVLWQLNGGPPKILLDVRYFFGTSFGGEHLAPRVLPFPSQVIYNRVGKCGSRTLVLLLRILAERHRFTLISSDIHNKTRLSKREQLNVMTNISTLPQPFLYARHVHFLNFTRFRIDEPVYINIIRDPINRFLSNYFFRRFGDWRGEENHLIRTPAMKDDERYLDINTCILESYAECSNPRLFYIIPYFCGQQPQCRFWIGSRVCGHCRRLRRMYWNTTCWWGSWRSYRRCFSCWRDSCLNSLPMSSTSTKVQNTESCGT